MTEPMLNRSELPLAFSECTLPTAERPLRQAEFDDLLATGVRAVDRVGPTRVRLDLVPQGDVAARAADLAVRETECCSFFTFTLSATGGQLTLEATVPDRYSDVLDTFAGRAAAGGERTDDSDAAHY